ncbi:MAG: hypothetical protein ACOY0R_19340 [Chloroflexota bacterium]
MKKRFTPTRWMLIALVFVSLACNFVTGSGGNQNQPAQPTVPAPQVTVAVEQPTAAVDGQYLRQWAISATASSEYGSTSWTAMQATGAPNVDECGDNGQAWASFSNNTLEWIELTYATPVVPTEINIYQSYNPSQVVQVDVISPDGITYTVWTGTPEFVEFCPDLMTITIDLDEEILAQKVVVIIDQSVLKTSWNEIDAVELVGRP